RERLDPTFAKRLMPLGQMCSCHRSCLAALVRGPVARVWPMAAYSRGQPSGRAMSRPRKPRGKPARTAAVFPDLSRAMFAASYPEGAHKLRHNLLAHPLLDPDSLTLLA